MMKMDDLAGAMMTGFANVMRSQATELTRKLLGRSGLPVAVPDQNHWVKPLANAVSPYLTTAMSRGRPSHLPSVDQSVVVDEAGLLADRIARSVVRSVREHVEGALSLNMNPDAVKGAMAIRIWHRAADKSYLKTTVQTELRRAYFAGMLLAVARHGRVEGKAWLKSEGCCQKCADLHDRRLSLSSPFFVDPAGGDFAVVPHPPLHPGCLCEMEIF